MTDASTAEAEPQTTHHGLTSKQFEQALEDYEKALPRIEAHARRKFAHFRDPGRREDAIANTIGIGWKNWLSSVRHGKDPNKFIPRIAARSAQAANCGNVTWREEPRRDVLSPTCHHEHGVNVEQLDEAVMPGDTDIHTGPHGQDVADSLEETLHDPSQTPPGAKASMGYLDLPEWLDSQTPRSQSIARDLADGYSAREVADRHGLSETRLSQIKSQFRQSWQEMHEGRGR